MNEFEELKVKGYANTARAYLEKPKLDSEEKDLLEDIFYNLYEIQDKLLSAEVKKLRLNILEKIALKRRIV